MIPGDRREIDDRAAARLLHRPHRLAAAEKHALRVDRADLAKVGERRRLDIAEGRDSGAVDENVEATESGEDRVDHFAPARFVGHVVSEREVGVWPKRLQARLVAVGCGDLGALAMKQSRRRPADAGRRASDERDFSRKASRPCSVHRLLPCPPQAR